MGRTEDALGPMLPEVKPFFFNTPLNWMYYRMISLFGGIPPGPPIKEIIPQIAPRPIFLIAAGKDPIEAGINRRYYKLAGENAQLWIIPDVVHLGGFLTHHDEYMQRMLAFFDRYLISP